MNTTRQYWQHKSLSAEEATDLLNYKKWNPGCKQIGFVMVLPSFPSPESVGFIYSSMETDQHHLLVVPVADAEIVCNELGAGLDFKAFKAL